MESNELIEAGGAFTESSELTGAGAAENRLRIAQVASLWLPVPPPGYGGAERIIDWLTRWLLERGHEVTLVASGDSRTPARLVPTVPLHLTRLMREGKAASHHHYVAASVAWVLAHQDEFDVIHMHVDPQWIPVMAAARTPVVFRLNTALSPDDVWALERFPGVHAAGISHRQLSGLSSEARARIPVIYNGCDFGRFQCSDRHDGYLAFLGRMGPHKNPLAAIDIARRAHMPLVLGGAPVDAQERAYFERHIRPLIDGDRVRYLGAVAGERKHALLRGAAALLFPIRWEEPFGIVMIEAMACGTPVLACAQGAVAEVIDCGLTGFHADSPEELVALVPEALALPRREVRRQAEQRFSHRRMSAEYLKLYASLAAASPRHLHGADPT